MTGNWQPRQLFFVLYLKKERRQFRLQREN